jgi:hypothetical protein
MVSDTSEGYMSIELSKSQYWKRMGYHDALLYCSLLVIDDKDDWRMMTMEEYEHNIRIPDDVWYLDNINAVKIYLHYDLDAIIIPVRDV